LVIIGGFMLWTNTTDEMMRPVLSGTDQAGTERARIYPEFTGYFACAPFNNDWFQELEEAQAWVEEEIKTLGCVDL
jgi:hypothetical protein